MVVGVQSICYFLHSAYYLLLATRYLVLGTYCLLPTAYDLLLTACSPHLSLANDLQIVDTTCMSHPARKQWEASRAISHETRHSNRKHTLNMQSATC